MTAFRDQTWNIGWRSAQVFLVCVFFQHQYLWLRNCHINVSLTSTMKRKATPTVKVKDFKVNVKYWWIFQDVNINISHSNLFKIQVRKTFSLSSTLRVNIDNSTFRALHTSGKCEVFGNYLYFIVGNETTHPLMDISNSRMVLSQSHFIQRENSSSALLLNATHSDVTVRDTTFQDMLSIGGIIRVQNKSELFLERVAFVRNGNLSSLSAITLSLESSIRVVNSVFSWNEAANGSCIYMGVDGRKFWWFQTLAIRSNCVSLPGLAVMFSGFLAPFDWTRDTDQRWLMSRVLWFNYGSWFARYKRNNWIPIK